MFWEGWLICVIGGNIWLILAGIWHRGGGLGAGECQIPLRLACRPGRLCLLLHPMLSLPVPLEHVTDVH